LGPPCPEPESFLGEYRFWGGGRAARFSARNRRIADECGRRLAKPDVRNMHCTRCEHGFGVGDEVLVGPWGVTAYDEGVRILRGQKGSKSSSFPIPIECFRTLSQTR
ncbi:hypothetical protein ACFLWA_12430, partial [Chloroflexota bacterium]